MSFKPGYRARILNGDFALYTKLNTITLPTTVDMLDVTVFGEAAKRFIPGPDTSTVSCEGFVDADGVADNVAWTTAQPITYAFDTLSAGSPVVMVEALKSTFELGSAVGDAAKFTLEGQTDGPTDFGVSLHDLTAETVDGNGTAVDGGASTTTGGVAHLHVTALSGLTGAVVTIEDSANGSSGWATIATFADATGATYERAAIAGTIRRYTRAVVDVTGTGSVTYSVALARR